MSCKRATFIGNFFKTINQVQKFFVKFVNNTAQRRNNLNLGAHKNYHSSREPRSTIVKLTPQEVRIFISKKVTH